MKAEISGLSRGPVVAAGALGRPPPEPDVPVPGHAEEARVAGTARAVAYCRR